MSRKNYLYRPQRTQLISFIAGTAQEYSELEFLKSLWGLGTVEEEGKAVNREDKRSRRYRDRHFAKFERSRRYRDRYRC